MPTLSITQSWAANVNPTETDIDNIRDAMLTFINTTKIDDDNVQTGGITGSTAFVASSATKALFADATVTRAKQAAKNYAEATTEISFSSRG